MAVLQANDEEFVVGTREALPAHLLIKIESFSLLSKQGIDKYESREFEAGDHKWKLIIHPNGPIESEYDGNSHISAYLAIVKGGSTAVGWEVDAYFSILLYNQVLNNYRCFQGKTRSFNPVKTQWGFSKLISKQSLRAPGNGFLINDHCVFGAEVAVIKKCQVTECLSVRQTGSPYKRDWKLSNFSKLEKNWYSEEFSVGDKKWKLSLFPNGNNQEEGRSVSMYLFLVGAKSLAAHERVKADYHLRIKNQLSDQHHSKSSSRWLTSALDNWGFPALMPLTDMRDPRKGFVIKDCCCIEVEISVKAVVRDAP